MFAPGTPCDQNGKERRRGGEEELVMVTKGRRDQRYLLSGEANKLQEMSYIV